MNYSAHYDRLITRARTRILTGYVERHHVIPKCMGGNNDRTNIVRLTPEEHYVAHQLLTKIYPEVGGLALAAFRMSRQCTGRKAYGWLRRRLAKAIGEIHRGKKKPPRTEAHTQKLRLALIGRRGAKRSPEARAKTSAALRGRKKSPEHIRKIADAKRGRPLPSAHRAKISEALRGKKFFLGHRHSDESKALMSRQRRGRKLPPLSEAHKRAVSEANSRRVVSDETREKIGASQRGVPKSPESKAKISETQRARWAARKAAANG